MALAVELLRLALNTQTSGQLTCMDKALTYGVGHGLPYLAEVGFEIFILVHKDVIREPYVTCRTKVHYFGKALFGIHLGGSASPVAFDTYLTAAYTHKVFFAHKLICIECGYLKGVGVRQILFFGIKYYISFYGSKNVCYGSVGAVTLSGLGKGAVKRHLKAVCIGVGEQHPLRRKGRPHGMGAGGSDPYLKKITYRFHFLKSFLLLDIVYHKRKTIAISINI